MVLWIFTIYDDIMAINAIHSTECRQKYSCASASALPLFTCHRGFRYVWIPIMTRLYVRSYLTQKYATAFPFVFCVSGATGVNVVILHFGCSGRLEGGPACSPGCARCSVGRRSRSSSPGGVQRGEYPSVFQEMAEQRGYFVASEWAQGGCTTLYQLPEEGKTVLLLLNNFHSCFFSPPSEALEPAYVQVEPYYSIAKLLSMRTNLGGRGSVCARAEALAAYGLHYVRTAFRFKTERQHCCEMDYSQQQ